MHIISPQSNMPSLVYFKGYGPLTTYVRPNSNVYRVLYDQTVKGASHHQCSTAYNLKSPTAYTLSEVVAASSVQRWNETNNTQTRE